MKIDAHDVAAAMRDATKLIEEQRAAIELLHGALGHLLNAAEDMRHGGYKDALVAAYDGWAREAVFTLAKHAPAPSQESTFIGNQFGSSDAAVWHKDDEPPLDFDPSSEVARRKEK